MVLRLIKEPDNVYDEEAIRAELEPVGKIGYIANSVHTVPRGCASAGRIYDTFDRFCFGIIRFVVGDTVILELINVLSIGITVQEEIVDGTKDERIYQESEN